MYNVYSVLYYNMFVIYSVLVVAFFFDSGKGQYNEDEYILLFYSSFTTPDDGVSSEYIDCSKVDMKQYNESFSCLTGDVTLMKNLPENAAMEVKVEKDTGMTFQLTCTMCFNEVCSELSDEKSQLKSFIEPLGLPKECPLRAGTFTLHDYAPDMSTVPINDQLCAKYRVTLSFYTSDEPTVCESNNKVFLYAFQFMIIIEPK